MLNRNEKILFGTLLVGAAIAERVWFDLGANVELVTVVAFVASYYLGKRWGVILPLIVLAVTDMALGNTPIMLFTWSAYVGIGLGAYVLGNSMRFSEGRILSSIAGGALAALWFFLWTNFGVWLLDGWGMYPDTFSGLMQSYVNGLPFLRNQFIGNVLFVPAFIISIETYVHVFRNIASQKYISLQK